MTTIHLLYVDDEENWLNAVGQILQTGEFVVDTATDGEMALQKMAEQRYDMILLDVRLKEENGWELVRRFKQVQREVAVVLFTSDYEVERLTDVFGVGVEDYLEKSSDIGILANRLKALHYRFVKSREQQECYRIASEVFFRVNAGILVVKGKERYLKSNEALTKMFEDAGLSKDDEIVTYCTGGIRSAYTQLVMEMCGFEHTYNYDQSFWRWAVVGDVE